MRTLASKLFAVGILFVATSQAEASRLAIDGWSDRQNVRLNQWVSRRSDAARPCKAKLHNTPPRQVAGARAACRIHREAGRSAQRTRIIDFTIPGARWKGINILSMRYEQDYALEERMTFHDSMSYILEGTCSALAPVVKGWWKARGVQYPEQAGFDDKTVVEYEAGIETLEPRGKNCEFRSEFYE